MRRRRRRMLTPIARRSLRRDDPLGWLYTHGHIDDAQFKAGRKMQKLYAAASVAALDKIAKLEAALGRNGASLARDFWVSATPFFGARPRGGLTLTTDAQRGLSVSELGSA